jgi:hypothetical protein
MKKNIFGDLPYFLITKSFLYNNISKKIIHFLFYININNKTFNFFLPDINVFIIKSYDIKKRNLDIDEYLYQYK